MTIKASGRSALILATGLLVCLSGPSPAATGADDTAASSKPEIAAGAPIVLNKYAKHGSRLSKSSAPHKSSKEAVKSSDKKPAAADVAAKEGGDSAIPTSVANANAQLPSTDTSTGNAKAMSARANDILQAAPGNPANALPAAETQVVAADQLNELDIALHESKPAAPMLAMASADTPVMASSNESTTWDQTSLVGKIFIAFGGLLTLASAARMFMA